MEDEDVPFPSEELRRLESLFFNKYKLRIPADGDAKETVVSRLRRQLNKHCIRFENILKTDEEGRNRRDQSQAHETW